MMDIDCCTISYDKTHRFSALIEAYLAQEPHLKPFFEHPLGYSGVQDAIEERKSFTSEQRNLLAQALKRQYQGQYQPAQLDDLLARLEKPQTFTITTAHQTNLLLGPVYLIYKVMHTIVLAEQLKQKFPDNDFIGVYYLGSEDNDWDELDHFYYQQQKYQWKTDQTGAFGSAVVDDALLALISTWKEVVLKDKNPFQADLVDAIEASYQKGKSITEANRHLIHLIFKNEDLLIIDGNDVGLKNAFKHIMKDDLIHHHAEHLVQKTSEHINTYYKTQAFARPINLFYLLDGVRERIEFINEHFHVVDTDIKWTKEALLEVLDQHPERFSPNVILRPVFQELILPNVAFVGGGSEVGYWMQLIEVFKHYKVPFPVLILRQSLTFFEEELINDWEKMDLSLEYIFESTDDLWKKEATKHLPEALDLTAKKAKVLSILEQLQDPIKELDATLSYSLGAVENKINYQLEILEKKILRAQKRNLNTYKEAISDIQEKAFPYGGGLSERKEGFFMYYEMGGQNWINFLKNHTDPLGKLFIVGIYKNY